MKIDKLLSHDFPSGFHRFAVLSNKTLKTKKAQKWIKNVKTGRARTRSLYTGEHTVVLAADLPDSISAVAYGYLQV